MAAFDKLNRVLTPEFRLLAACAWLDESDWPAQRDMVLTSLGLGIDPEQFFSLVKRHRVPVLAYTVLTRATNDAGLKVGWIQRLRPAARQTQIQSLRLHSEWQRIEKLCMDARIRVRTLKGAGLSTRLYRDPGVRHTRDIDALVAPDDMERLLDLLESADYTVDRGFAPHRRRSLAFRIARSLEYHTSCRSKEGLLVEVHSHIERPLNSAIDENWAGLAWGSGLHTQARFDLLYCTLHGCLHGWSRLKWLGDLRVMAGRITEKEWPAVIELAEELRLQCLVAETLLLLHWITGFVLPEAALKLIERSGKSSRRLADQSIDWISAPESDLSSLTILPRIRRWHLAWRVGQRLPLRERAMYWLSQGLFSSTDMRAVELPAWLTGLYPVIRPLSLLGRSIFGAGSKSG